MKEDAGSIPTHFKSYFNLPSGIEKEVKNGSNGDKLFSVAFLFRIRLMELLMPIHTIYRRNIAKGGRMFTHFHRDNLN